MNRQHQTHSSERRASSDQREPALRDPRGKVRWLNVAIAAAFQIAVVAAPGLAADAVDFARDVQPLLAQYCTKCHGPEKQMNQAPRMREELSCKRNGFATSVCSISVVIP